MIDTIGNMAPAWLQAHAAALLVAVPLICAAINTFLNSGRLSWLVVMAVAAFSFVCSLVLLWQVQDGEVVRYALGGFAPPHGIEFRIDSLNAMFLLLVTGFGLVAAVCSWPTIKAEINPAKHSLFYSAYLVCLTGLAGVAITNDAFNLFVFLEISSIATYVLVAIGARRDRRALPAAFNYLIMGTIGATFFVIGVGFLYAATGTLNMSDMARLIPQSESPRAVQAGLSFIVVGLGLKLAMWPLHSWLPNAYAYAPSFVTIFLSATATKVALYAVIRFLTYVFPQEEAEAMLFAYVFAPLGIAAMVVCSFQAVFQTDVRRTLAYSSVAQVGYMLLGLSLATQTGIAASLLFLFNHALMKGALFMALAGVVLHFQGTQMRDMAGLGRQAPWTMTAFAIAALSLIGVPLTAGFQSKFALLSAVLEHGWPWAAFIIVATSLLAVIYMGRIVEAAFFRAPVNPDKVHKEAPLALLAPLWLLAIANIWIGVDASVPIGLAQAAAEAAIGSGAPAMMGGR